MLVKQPYGYRIIKDIEEIDFNKSFMYRTESMDVEYNHLEKVFGVCKRESESHSVAVVTCLKVLSEYEQIKLKELIRNDVLLEIAETGELEDLFEADKILEKKRFIDFLREDEKDELLLSLISNAPLIK